MTVHGLTCESVVEGQFLGLQFSGRMSLLTWLWITGDCGLENSAKDLLTCRVILLGMNKLTQHCGSSRNTNVCTLTVQLLILRLWRTNKRTTCTTTTKEKKKERKEKKGKERKQ